MTPCTSLYGTDLVAGACNAGFHAELACGGLPRPSIFRATIQPLTRKLTPGSVIGLNMLYLNSRQWAFQAPAVAALLAEGLPIETVCIAADVPTLDTALGIVGEFAAAGDMWVFFKLLLAPSSPLTPSLPACRRRQPPVLLLTCLQRPHPPPLAAAAAAAQWTLPPSQTALPCCWRCSCCWGWA
jgi:hypothetical protein